MNIMYEGGEVGLSKKKKKEKYCCSNQIFNPIVQPFSFSNVKIIPVRDIPDNCQLVCVGPFCSLVCFGEDLRVIHCDIVCDDAGNCTVNCTPSGGGGNV